MITLIKYNITQISNKQTLKNNKTNSENTSN